MADDGYGQRLLDGLANIFSSDDDLELQMGIGADLDEAYEDALERSPDYVDDDTVETRHSYGTLDPSQADVDIDAELEGEHVLAGIEYQPEDQTRDRKTSGSGPAYDEPGTDGTSLTDIEHLS